MVRVSTEPWVVENFYCPACGTELQAYPHGHRVYDFFSPVCKENFQLKSAAHRFGDYILGSEYRTTLNSILSSIQPSFILLGYDRDKWAVENLSLIHRACITESCIIPRKPLSSSARRAGWQGCLISISQIPKLGQIPVVTNGLVREKISVITQWKQSSSLLKSKPEFRGWLADILTCVEKLMTTFTLDDMYAFEEELGAKHPENHNIRPKIRQQLQVLRDLGLIKFISSGQYEYVGKLPDSSQE